jgi:hypothetical protein
MRNRVVVHHGHGDAAAKLSWSGIVPSHGLFLSVFPQERLAAATLYLSVGFIGIYLNA